MATVTAILSALKSQPQHAAVRFVLRHHWLTEPRQLTCLLFTNPLRVVKASVQTLAITGIAGQAIRITLEVPSVLKAFPTTQVLEAGRIQITYLLRLAKSQSRRRLDTLFAQISGGMPVPIAQRFTIRCRALLKMPGNNTEYDEITRTTGANRCEM